MHLLTLPHKFVELTVMVLKDFDAHETGFIYNNTSGRQIKFPAREWGSVVNTLLVVTCTHTLTHYASVGWRKMDCTRMRKVAK